MVSPYNTSVIHEAVSLWGSLPESLRASLRDALIRSRDHGDVQNIPAPVKELLRSFGSNARGRMVVCLLATKGDHVHLCAHQRLIVKATERTVEVTMMHRITRDLRELYGDAYGMSTGVSTMHLQGAEKRAATPNPSVRAVKVTPNSKNRFTTLLEGALAEGEEIIVRRDANAYHLSYQDGTKVSVSR